MSGNTETIQETLPIPESPPISRRPLFFFFFLSWFWSAWLSDVGCGTALNTLENSHCIFIFRIKANLTQLILLLPASRFIYSLLLLVRRPEVSLGSVDCLGAVLVAWWLVGTWDRIVGNSLGYLAGSLNSTLFDHPIVMFCWRGWLAGGLVGWWFEL